MKKITINSLICSVLAIGLAGCSTTTYNSHGVVDKHAQGPSWSYQGDTGPEFWGDIEGNQTCKIGQEQSPINIKEVTTSASTAPISNFTTSDIEVMSNGHTIVYTPLDSKNTTTINGDVYTLKQFHYHTPSEHQVSGVNYPAEVHFVHANADGNLAVLGVMLNPNATESDKDMSFDLLVKASKAAMNSNKTLVVENVNVYDILPAANGYYHYSGSLTTPPCSEKVQWYVMQNSKSITAAELQTLTELYEGNNRPVTPIGSRDVLFVK